MALTRNGPAAATAVAAAVCLCAPPAAALELPRLSPSPQAERAGALDAANRRHGRHWDDDDWDIDGDDILTGVLILGGLAAIAGIAGSGRDRAERYPEPEPLPEEADYQAPVGGDRYRAGGMAEAVDTCVAEVEADRGAVASVDRASRSGEGWYVAGELADGPGYACWIDGEGRVTDIEAGDYGASYDDPASDGPGEVALQKQALDGQLEGHEVAQAGVVEN